tara:strand:+ start:761 stop:994 length:234 start_codon:yes stop_codon:yes gene_type:complete
LNSEVEVVNAKVLLDSKKVIELGVESSSIIFKIDLVNSRSMGSGSDIWEDIEIVDGVIQICVWVKWMDSLSKRNVLC